MVEAGVRRSGELDPAKNPRPLFEFLRWLKPYRGTLGLILLSLLVSGAAELGIGLAIRGIVDNAFTTHRVGLTVYFLPMFGVVGLYATASFFRLWKATWLGERVAADVRTAVFSHLLGLSPAFFETTKTAEVLSRLVADTSLIETLIAETVPATMRSLFLLLGGGTLLTISSGKLSTMVFLMLPIMVLPAVPFGRWVRRLSRVAQDQLADVSVIAHESLHAVKTLQAFTRESTDRARFAQATESAFRAARRRIFVQSLFSATVVLLIFALINSVLWVGARDVLEGRISAGELTAFVFYAVLMAASFAQLSGLWGQLQRVSGAAERLLELSEIESEVASPKSPTTLPQCVRGGIRFEQVDFHYPSRPEVGALVDFSLDVAAGETIALVGPSGAGKSTVFNLLLRFYDPQAGRVLLEGVDLKSLDLRDLRSRIAYVSQEPDIFSGTVADNIRYGRPEASDEEVRQAAETSAALDFIEQLPDRFNTRLGERAMRLSGGQRQRIAIARCVLCDSPILLFDEATSALDSASERMVQRALEQLAAKRTTIVIAHRLATVQQANRIIVLDKGRIVATGTHAELIEQDGLYAQFVRMQLQTVADGS